MKIMNKATIKIYFKDGKIDELSAKIWDDYQYLEEFFHELFLFEDLKRNSFSSAVSFS